MKKIRVVQDGEERDVPLESSLVVGRDPRCDVHDADPELSRRHAEFVVEARGIVVRDLNSRNGIRVNGVRLTEAVLRSGDVVQAAKLQMRYVDDAFDDPTQDAADATEDRTVVVPSGARRRDAETTEPPPARGPASDDRTSLLVPPPGRDAAAAAAPHTAPIAAASGAPAAAPASARPATRRARASWGGRVLLQSLALALVVFLLAWVPMSISQSRLVNEAAVARARALVQWLAADAAANLARGAGAREIGARVATEPGVIAYLVMAPSGEVVAPPARARSQVSKLPGLGSSPSEISRFRAQWNGDVLEVALPVAVGDDPRAAIAWLQLRPSAGGGDNGLLLVPLLLLALLLGWLAAIGVRRRTLSALARFNEDVDLLLAGQGSAVQDPMGTPPTKTLADVINHLASRLRAGDSSAGMARRAADPEPRRAPAGDPPTVRDARPVVREAAPGARPAAAAPPARECRIVASPTFRVTEASAGCADLLGVRPESLVGQHVLDTIPDRAILDAILKSLSKLPAAGEERATVTPEARPFRLAIVVSRSGRNEPITIAFSIDGERA